MNKYLCTGAIIKVPNDDIGETIIDEMFDSETNAKYLKSHVLADRCDQFIGRDAGDNLIVVVRGKFMYWDHESNELILLGAEPGEFVIGLDE
nr:hypothetical protein [uncultured Undibacterium sp.]